MNQPIESLASALRSYLEQDVSELRVTLSRRPCGTVHVYAHPARESGRSIDVVIEPGKSELVLLQPGEPVP